MNNYEALVIFPDSLTEEQVEAGLNQLKSEIQALGGSVSASARMGRRAFARPQGKLKSGEFVLVGFQAPAQSIPSLRERVKLAAVVFRMMITRAVEPAAAV